MTSKGYSPRPQGVEGIAATFKTIRTRLDDLAARITGLPIVSDPPMLYATLPSDKTIADSTYTTMPVTASLDTHNALSGGLYTVPLSGVYRIAAGFRVGGFSGNKYVRITSDGGYNYATMGGPATNADSVAVEVVTSLSSGSKVGVSIYQSSGSTQTVRGLTATYGQYFTVQYMRS